MSTSSTSKHEWAQIKGAYFDIICDALDALKDPTSHRMWFSGCKSNRLRVSNVVQVNLWQSMPESLQHLPLPQQELLHHPLDTSPTTLDKVFIYSVCTSCIRGHYLGYSGNYLGHCMAFIWATVWLLNNHYDSLTWLICELLASNCD